MPQTAPNKALVVEDDHGVSALGAMMLEELDLIVVQVSTAEEAIEHLRACGGAITVMLTDVHLPGSMDGMALVSRVAVLWPSISLIVTSGDPKYSGAEMPRGVSYVPKPWRPLDIVAAAERAARADHSIRAVRL